MTARMTGVGADDQLALFVAGLRKLKGHGTTLYRAFPVSDPVGTLSTTVEVAVPRVFQAACVTAIAVPAGHGDPRSLLVDSDDSRALAKFLALPKLPRSGCTLEGPRIGTIFLRVPRQPPATKPK